MKASEKFILTCFTFIIILFTGNSYSQIPKTINYQAVARNDDGSPIADRNIVVEISVLQGNECDNGAACSLRWREIHYVKTNEFGMFSINIGDGISTNEGSITNFDDIDWLNTTNGAYYIKVRADFSGGSDVNGMIDMGTSKLQSVPYSLACESAELADEAKQLTKNEDGNVSINLTDLNNVQISNIKTDDIIKWDGSKWVNSEVPSVLDLNLGTLKNNDMLLYDGTNWVNKTFYMANASDVSLNSVSANQILQYTGSAWKNTDLNLSTLSDVSLGTLTSGDVLTWDGSKWVNQASNNSNGSWVASAPYFYYAGSYNVGIGTTTPQERIHFNFIDNEGFLITGKYDATGSISSLGAGCRLMFYPVNASFRAGEVTGNEWDNASVGAYSAAFGYNTIASGEASFAAGSTNTAGKFTAVFGKDNQTSGQYSFAAGDQNSASGINSVVFGSQSSAKGAYSFACGLSINQATAAGEGNYSFAAGNSTNAKGEASVAIGALNEAQGDYSVAMGYNTRTSTNNSIAAFAMGSGTLAQGKYSSAWGEGTISVAYGMMTIGRFNNTQGTNSSSWDGNDPVFVIGNGASTTSRSDALIVKQNGDMTIAGTLTQNSDARLKTNITPITGALSSILSLNGVFYKWNKKIDINKYRSDKRQVGLIAQEVEKYFPELVGEVNGYKTVNYIGIIPVLIEAVKQQQDEITELKKENQLLKKQMQDILTRLDKLEKNND